MPPRWPRGRTSRRAARIAADHLEQHLPDEQNERARDVEAVGEEGAVAGFGSFSASIRLTVRITSSASPDSRLPRLAPPSTSRPDAVCVPALDLGAVGRRRAGHHTPGLLLHPPERRDILVRAKQDPAWLAPVWRRGPAPIRRARSPPRRASVPWSARCRLASPPQHRQARARRSRGTGFPARRCGSASLAPGDPPDDAQRELVVVVGPRSPGGRSRPPP